jgi:hypothetical protein
MMALSVTCGHLYDALLKLGFGGIPHQGTGRAYRHATTGVLILLADRPPSTPARLSDLASVRRHLVENGIIDESAYDRFLASGELPQVPT